MVRIDLLGHGGSEKPKSGYSMDEQAALVAGALRRLNVEGAVVVGHSLGGTVGAALASRATELVSRLVIIDQAPDNSYGPGLGLVANLGYLPVIGEAMYRFTQGFPGSSALIKSGYADAFAPDFDIDSGFPNPDQVVEDLRAMTYTSFDRSPDGGGRLHRGDPAQRTHGRHARAADGDLRGRGPVLRRRTVAGRLRRTGPGRGHARRSRTPGIPRTSRSPRRRRR